MMLLGLAGCSLLGGAPPAGPDNMQGRVEGWRVASGRPPTRAEYTAIVAACRDRAVRDAQGRPLAACLANLGLKRAE
ncbi:MAG TPA: hypothetical protein VND95_12650 [Stellaceae bacterium]|nr:hypothetical protein [Stellaceae bacterium]